MNTPKLLASTLIAAAAFVVPAQSEEISEDTTISGSSTITKYTSAQTFTLSSGVTLTYEGEIENRGGSSSVSLVFENAEGATGTKLVIGTFDQHDSYASVYFGNDETEIGTFSYEWMGPVYFTAGSTKITTATFQAANWSDTGQQITISSGASVEIGTATYSATNSGLTITNAGTLKITSFSQSSSKTATFTNNSGTIEIGTYTMGNGTATFSGTSISITTELIQNSNSATINVYAEEATIAKLTTKYSGSIVFGNGTDSMTATVATLSLNNVANSTTYQYDKITIAANATLSVGTITANSSKDNLQITNSGTLNIGTSDESSTSLTYGTVTISGSGTTNIVGTFSTTQSFTNANALNISGAATFSGTTTLTGTLTNTGTATFSGTTTLSGAVTNSGTLTLSGTLSLSSTIENTGTISVSDAAIDILISGTADADDDSATIYTLASGGAVSLSGSETYTLNGEELSSRTIVTVSTEGGWTVTLSGSTADLVWSGSTGTTWSNSTSDANWTNGDSSDYFVSKDNVTFDSTGTSKTVSVAEDLEVGNFTVSGGVEYSFSTEVSGGVTISSGTLSVAAGSGVSGKMTIGENVTISAESLTRTGGATFEVNGALNVSGDATFVDEFGLAQAISGTGTVNIAGTLYIRGGSAGTMEISVANFTAGSVMLADSSSNVNSGTITLSSANFEIGTLTAPGGTLIISGSGTITNFKNSSSTTTALSISSGANVEIGNFSNSWGLTTLTVDGTLIVSDDFKYSTGSGTNTITGSGTIVANKFTVGNNGTYVVDGGITMIFSSSSGITEASSVYSYSLTLKNVTLGGTTDWTASSSKTITLAADSGSATVFNTAKYDTETGIFSETEGTDVTISFAVSGSGALTKTGVGTLTFAGTTTLSGDISVEAGTLTFSGTTTLSGAISNAGTLNFSGTTALSGTISNSGTLNLSGTIELPSAIENTGTIVLDVSNIVFDLANISAESDGSYVVISNSGDGTISNWTDLTANNFVFSGTVISGRSTLDLETSGVVAISPAVGVELIWTNDSGDYVWNVQGSTNWKIFSSDVEDQFYLLDNVTFSGTEMDSGSGTISNYVTIEENISVTNMYVTEGSVVSLNATSAYSLSGTTLTVDSGTTLQIGISSSSLLGLDFDEILLGGTLDYRNGSGYTWNSLTFTADAANLNFYSIKDSGSLSILKVSVEEGISAEITALWGGSLNISQLTGAGNLAVYAATGASASFSYSISSLDGFSGTLEIVGAKTLSSTSSFSSSADVYFSGTNSDETERTIKISSGVAFLGNTSSSTATAGSLGSGTTLEIAEGAAFVNNATASTIANLVLSGTYLQIDGVSVSSGTAFAVSGTTTISGTAATLAMYWDKKIELGTLDGTSSDDVLTILGASQEAATAAGATTATLGSFSGTIILTGRNGSNTTLTLSKSEGKTLEKVALTNSILELADSNSVSAMSDALAIKSLDISGTGTLKSTNLQSGFSISELAGTSATLNLISASASEALTEFLVSGGDFSGTVNVSATSASEYNSATLVVAGESVFENAVIAFGTNSAASGTLSLGINADNVKVAGITSTSGTATYLYSGEIEVGTSGATSPTSGTTARTLEITGSDSYTFYGTILANVNIVMSGSGTQTFAGASADFNGTVTISAGTIAVADASAFGSGTISVEGGTLEVAADVTLSNTISIVLDSYQISTVATISGDSSGTTTALAGSGTISAVTLVASEAVISALVDLGEISFAIATQEFNLVEDMISFSESLAFALTNYNYATTYDAGVYTISILAIPEPSMFGIFAGLAALTVAAKRRRRK